MLQQFYPQVQHDFRYELNKDMHLSTAHYIPDEGAGVCQRVHGHTYFINVTVAGDELDSSGFLINFKLLKELVHERWDHRLLNDDPLFSATDGNHFPTTEVVARKVWEIVQEVLDSKPNKPVCVQVVVRETPTSYVVFRPKKGVDY
ncbi:6-pyruvoyl trahydropterin synthase family protein [Alicyclobacillus pomorum]|jgi:6-pyruvoyltetrahydropterin/6-carboxytetrahydropterin synthase|uniref:6-pyruvoyl trahydropterin synthase family protein n=1 Tax=Alicyclobacillus pomorum TaxID=204470 RepID=UPI0003FACA89|nr:6-pyruvoyl tetrahydropterin synthase family protein [Alicyclobacillus pomorum]